MSSFAVQNVGQQQAPGEMPAAPPAPPAEDAVVDIGPRTEELLDRLRDLENLEGLRDLEQLRHINEQVADAMGRAGAQDPFIFPAAWHIPGELVGLVLGSLALLFLIIIGYPIARSFSRRSELKAMNAAQPSGEVLARLERIEHAVETMAVEIERISEGQRYTTRLLSERTEELKN